MALGIRELLLALLLTLSNGTSAPSNPLPRFQLTSLSGKAVVLPDAARGRVAILIVGFTQGSAKASAAWRQRMDAEFGKNPGYSIFDIAILEEVPRLFRGLVTGAIRRGIPAVLQDTFLTSFQDESAWKQVVSFHEKDDAYVMVLDRKGTILWQIHGLCTDVQYAEFRQRARSAQSPPS